MALQELDWLFREHASAVDLTEAVAILAAMAYCLAWIVYCCVVAARRRFGAIDARAASEDRSIIRLFHRVVAGVTLVVAVATLSLKGYLLDQINEQPCGDFVSHASAATGCCPAPFHATGPVCTEAVKLTAGLMRRALEEQGHDTAARSVLESAAKVWTLEPSPDRVLAALALALLIFAAVILAFDKRFGAASEANEAREQRRRRVTLSLCVGLLLASAPGIATAGLALAAGTVSVSDPTGDRAVAYAAVQRELAKAGPDNCPLGQEGPRGPKGDTGEPGKRGAAGSNGDKGASGQPGAKGDRGDKGDPGRPGDSGAPGESPTVSKVADELLKRRPALLDEMVAAAKRLAERTPSPRLVQNAGGGGK